MVEDSKAITIVRLMKLVMKKIKHHVGGQFKENNLTGPQGMLIGFLFQFGEMKISDISEKMGLSNSTVSGIADRLENQGVIERIRSTEDRRVVYIKLDEQFKKQSQNQFEDINKTIERMMEKASPEELDKIMDGLNTLVEVINRQER